MQLAKASEEYGYVNALSELTEKSSSVIDGDSYYRLQQNYQGIPVYGRTIAYVDNDNILHILNASLFCSIISHEAPRLLTVKEYAAKHGKQPAIIRRHCLDGLLKGATQMGNRWVIPEDCPYPTFE